MTYALGSFHYGILIQPNHGPQELRLYNSLEQAKKEAKFYLYNAEYVTVLDVQYTGFSGKSLLVTSVKRKLVPPKC